MNRIMHPLLIVLALALGETPPDALGAGLAGDTPAPIRLSRGFKEVTAPETGRRAIQLTSGNAFCYPLYYFVPSITKDGEHLIYHKAADGQVQLYRLDFATGESTRLTHGACPKTQWRYWCVESGSGVLDHRSVLNVERNEVIYFDGNRVHAVNVESLADRLLFVLPDDREAIGQNCTTPDGRWLVYIDAPQGSSRRAPCQGAKVVAYNFDTQEQRTLATIDVAIHHVVAYDNQHLIFCHPIEGMGIMMTDLESGKYVDLRRGDPGAKHDLCHFLMTRQGIVYEVPSPKWSGLYDPLTRRRFEFKLLPQLGSVHTGWDPEGRLWFYESSGRSGHELYFLAGLDEKQGDRWLKLVGNWPTFGSGQKAHFHPQLTPDRRWILLTAGDSATQTNHIFLLDASDLKDTEGISTELLSPTGANDRTKVDLLSGLRGKPIPVAAVKASASQDGYPAKYAADGDPASLWAASGENQWILLDLGQARSIGGVYTYWHEGDRRQERFEVAVSDDASTWTTVFRGTSSGTTAGLEPCAITPCTARYVRLTCHGNTANPWNSLREVVVVEKE